MGNKNVKQSLPFGLKTQFQREGKLLRNNSYKGVDDELTAGLLELWTVRADQELIIKSHLILKITLKCIELYLVPLNKWGNSHRVIMQSAMNNWYET